MDHLDSDLTTFLRSVLLTKLNCQWICHGKIIYILQNGKSARIKFDLQQYYSNKQESLPILPKSNEALTCVWYPKALSNCFDSRWQTPKDP